MIEINIRKSLERFKRKEAGGNTLHFISGRHLRGASLGILNSHKSERWKSASKFTGMINMIGMFERPCVSKKKRGVVSFPGVEVGG